MTFIHTHTRTHACRQHGHNLKKNACAGVFWYLCLVSLPAMRIALNNIVFRTWSCSSMQAFDTFILNGDVYTSSLCAHISVSVYLCSYIYMKKAWNHIVTEPQVHEHIGPQTAFPHMTKFRGHRNSSSITSHSNDIDLDCLHARCVCALFGWLVGSLRSIEVINIYHAKFHSFTTVKINLLKMLWID